MGTWSYAHTSSRCGFDTGHPVPEGELIYHVTGSIRRCQLHAPRPFTEADRDALELGAERAAIRDASGPLTPSQFVARVRGRAPRKLTPLKDLAEALPFDARMAALGERE